MEKLRTQEIDPSDISEPTTVTPQVVSRYEDSDFGLLYKREYFAHRETRLKLNRAEDHIVYLQGKIEKLEGDVAYLRKLMFSKKTEQGSQSGINVTECESVTTRTHGAQPGHEGHGRKIPSHLPTQDHVHHIAPEDCVCPRCGAPTKEMASEEISYEVTVEVQYILFRHRRKKYRKTCRCPHPILTAPGPLKLFKRGLYSMDFWIKVLLDKYAYGIPLSRQVDMMKGEGLDISDGSLADGLIRIVPYLKPLYQLMVERIAFEKLVHGDETRWYNWASRYDLNRLDKKARWWLWGFFSSLYHVFVIDPSRGADVISETLGQGEVKTVVPILMSDRWKPYQKAGNTVAFCWAHVRRDFLKIKIQHPTNEILCAWADTWLHLISDLYALNRLRLRHRDDPSLFQAHQKQLIEVCDRMEALTSQTYTKKPQIAQANSMRNHWEGLTLFLDNPEIPLDNNLAERALRTPVVGRKNFYGNHSDRATEATAIFYSILSTLKLHNLQPKKFLKHYLTACVEWKSRGSPMSKELLESFLPHEYAIRYSENLVTK